MLSARQFFRRMAGRRYRRGTGGGQDAEMPPVPYLPGRDPVCRRMAAGPGGVCLVRAAVALRQRAARADLSVGTEAARLPVGARVCAAAPLRRLGI